MFKPKKLILWIMVIFSSLSAISRESKSGSFKNDSTVSGLSTEESSLFNLINQIRIKEGLGEIPFSSGLSLVARVHINDLIASKPQQNGCNLHSWSGSGKWTSCCGSKNISWTRCMMVKPLEIAGYKGNGYELIYCSQDQIKAEKAVLIWQQKDASMDMITCRGEWKGYNWKAMGVGIKDGYAVVWFGDKLEGNQPLNKQQVSVSTAMQILPKNEVKSSLPGADINDKIKTLESEKSTETNYYLIAGSLKTDQAAAVELKRVCSKGYTEAFVLEGESAYRIAIAQFDSEKKAKAALKQFKEIFPGIWILKN